MFSGKQHKYPRPARVWRKRILVVAALLLIGWVITWIYLNSDAIVEFVTAPFRYFSQTVQAPPPAPAPTPAVPPARGRNATGPVSLSLGAVAGSALSSQKSAVQAAFSSGYTTSTSSPTPASTASLLASSGSAAQASSTLAASQDSSPAAKTETPAPANTGSLWGHPFVGYSLKEITHELAEHYAGRTPKTWGEKMPGITTHIPINPKAAGPTVALTLDACDGKGDAAYDAGLISFLREKKIPATLFVTSIWAKNNPQTLKELAADSLFEIGAHGTRHKPCSITGKEAYGIKGTTSLTDLVEEVEGNARDLQRATGKRVRWFRSGTAFYDDVAVAVIQDLGLKIAGYSISADEGASLSAAKVRHKASAAKNGDILLAHMNHPSSGTREGLKEALTQLLEKGYVFVQLSDQ